MRFTNCLVVLTSSFILICSYQASTTEPEIIYKRKGDILLGGLFPLHIYDESNRYCSTIRDLSSLKNLEGMVYAIDDINKKGLLLPNVTLGFEIYDSCFDFTVTVARCLHFLKKTRDTYCHFSNPGYNDCGVPIDEGPLVGIVGAQRSVCTIEAAMLLATDAIPVVSYLSTSDELSNRSKYPYFMRTVAPDTLQIKVIRDILLHFGWTFVNFLYSDDNYGQLAFRAFSLEEETHDFCVSFSQEVSSYWVDDDYDQLVKTLRQDPYSRAKISVLFMYVEQCRELMRAVQRAGAETEFTWIVSDGITVDGVRALYGVENVAAGSLAVMPFSNSLEDFDRHFYSKDYQVDPNPWGEEFEKHYCSNDLDCPPNDTEALSDVSSTDTLVMDSVYAFGYALHEIYHSFCQNRPDPKLCLQSLATNGTLLYSYLRGANFVSLANGFVKFNENGDAEGKYAIENWQLDESNVLRRVRVGAWTELIPEGSRLIIDDHYIKFHINSSSSTPSIPVSVCSHPCDIGLIRDFYSDKLCCWECKECNQKETVINSTVCAKCPEDTWPNINKTECVNTDKIFFGDSAGLGWTMTSVGCVGFLLELFHIALLTYNWNHVLIRIMEPVLTVSIFTGITLTFISTAMHSLSPEAVVCFFLRTGPGVALVLIYVPLAIKTIRCYRVFKAAKTTGSQKEAELWNNKRHIILISTAVMVQLIISSIWMATNPLEYHRSVFYSLEGGVYHHDACLVPDFQPVTDFLFNCIFLSMGCVFSILAHALPDNNYEIRLLAFSLFGTAILFFSVIVPYFTSPSDYKSLLYIAIGLNINGTFVLVCIFTPKLYIACFGSEEQEGEISSEQPGVEGVYRPRLKSRSSSLSLANRDVRPRNRSHMTTVKEVDSSPFSSI